jgi:nucleoside-diphosphate-sugar epimerase
MTTLVAGATGATGRLLVGQLLDRGLHVRVIVRSPDKLPDSIRNHEHLSIIHADILGLSDAEMADHVKGCDAIASCLGHNLNFRGMFGNPRRLVTDAVRRLCQAVNANEPGNPVRFVLMNTTGNRNRDLDERISFGAKNWWSGCCGIYCLRTSIMNRLLIICALWSDRTTQPWSGLQYVLTV